MLVHVSHPIAISGEKNPLALAACLRFHYKSTATAALLFATSHAWELSPEILSILREDPSWWKKPKLFRNQSLHGLQVPREEIFPRKNMHAGEVVHSLEGLHFEKECGHDWAVQPVNVPVGFVKLVH
jgi:hypothetical protein